MKTENTNPDITNVAFDQIVYYSEKVEYFNQIPEVNPIPANSVIYKTVTGIGTTYTEIVEPRNSIIVLPNIAIIKNKAEQDYPEDIKVFAIYGKVTQDDIMEYLAGYAGPYKLLVTPKGLVKLIKRFENCTLSNGEPVPYKQMFFLLIDECQKLIKDADYREDMVELIDLFFEFERKAMVSATPIPFSDPRFNGKFDDTDQAFPKGLFAYPKFKNIKVCPDYDYKQPIDVRTVPSLVNALNGYLKNNDADCYCIFFNSAKGIKGLIQKCDIKNNYLIHCSEETSEYSKLAGEPNVTSTIGTLKKYNFFTSSFFNGLDIHMNNKPDIIMMTDYTYGGYTLLDPFTDILQILGRFRRNFEQIKNKEVSYRKATHFNNARHFTTPKSQPEVLQAIEISKMVYEHLLTLKQSRSDDAFLKILDQQLETIKPYAGFLTKKGKFSYVLKDNYLDKERVKTYYKSPGTLANGYTRTRLYHDRPLKREVCEGESIIRLPTESFRYSPALNKRMADDLLELEDYKGLNIYNEIRAQIERLSFVMFDAYNRLGYPRMASLAFKTKPIKVELLKLDVEAGINSFPLINMVYETFYLNKRYTVKLIKKELAKIYEMFSVPHKATATDITRYFEIKETKKNDERAYVFIRQKLNPVTHKQHI